MAYRITGLPVEDFEFLFGADEATLAAHGAKRVVADAKPGAPCRITLEDAEPGESLILINHVSLDGDGPYRASHAIFVRELAEKTAVYFDQLPPVFAPRVLSMRGFDANGMMIEAQLAQPGEAVPAIHAIFANPAVEQIHAHNAVRGCFSARIERHG